MTCFYIWHVRRNIIQRTVQITTRSPKRQRPTNQQRANDEHSNQAKNRKHQNAKHSPYRITTVLCFRLTPIHPSRDRSICPWIPPLTSQVETRLVQPSPKASAVSQERTQKQKPQEPRTFPRQSTLVRKEISIPRMQKRRPNSNNIALSFCISSTSCRNYPKLFFISWSTYSTSLQHTFKPSIPIPGAR